MTTYVWPTRVGTRATGTMVTDVIDGDTVDAIVVEDRAFGRQEHIRLRARLNRVNAPKLSSVAGKAARAALLQLVDKPIETLTTVKVYKYAGPDGEYRGTIPGGPLDYGGEYMVEILLRDGTNVSDLMVAAGHATYWDGTGPRPADELRRKFVEADSTRSAAFRDAEHAFRRYAQVYHDDGADPCLVRVTQLLADTLAAWADGRGTPDGPATAWRLTHPPKETS